MHTVYGRLTASEGYTWVATSGNYSPYQTVTSTTLSNFTLEAVDFGLSVSFPGVFSITAGQRYALIVTVDEAENLLLLLVNEGAVMQTGPQQLAASYAPVLGRSVRDSTTSILFSRHR